jgi:tellurite resistance protein TerA
MTELTQGGNAPIQGNNITVVLEWSPTMIGGSEVDISAFMLAGNGKVRNDNDFIFYGSKTSGCGSVRMEAQSAKTQFHVDLSRVPAAIEKVAFTATLTRAQWSQAQSLRLSIVGAASYAMVTSGKTEAAVIVGELYKRNGAWKIRAVGQGFNGGLGPLATSFGVVIDEEPAPPPAPPPSAAPPRPVAAPTPAPATAPPPAPALAPAPRVSLSKVTLDKQGSSAKLSLDKVSSREIVINLNWTQPRGLFAQTVDLDLGAFVKLRNGQKKLIDGIQFSRGRGGPRNHETNQGCFVASPWVWHAGDDRTGGVAEGENIYVNPEGLRDIERIDVYTFIYEGAANWSETNAVATIKIPNQEIAVQMGRLNDARTFCMLAQLKFHGESEIEVTKRVSFHKDHEDCDRSYGWGFRWSAGSK